MKMEKAIQAAIDYETKIRDIYRDAAQRVHDPEGKKFFKMMGDDEQYHLDHLRERLRLWRNHSERNR